MLRRSAAADERASCNKLDTEVAQLAGQALAARPQFLGRLGDHSQRRDLIPPFQEQIPQSGFESLVNQLVEPQRAKHRIAAQARDQLPVARQNPGLRATQKLVAAEGNQIRARADALGHQRFFHAERAQVGDAAAAQVLIYRNAALPSERHQFGERRPRRESFDTEVARMDAQQQPRAFCNRFPIVLNTRSIRGSHLTEDRAGSLHDLRDSKPIADLDQLAARNHHFEARGQLVQSEINRRSIVVHRDARRSDKPLQQIRYVHVAFASRSPGKVVLQIRIAEDRIKTREWSAPQVGVQYNPGRIDDAPQRWRFESRQALFYAGLDRCRVFRAARADLLAQPLEHTPDFFDDETPWETRLQMREAGEDPIDGRDFAQLVLGGQTTMVSCFMDPITVLVISKPAASYLRPLERLPQPVNLLVGETPEFLEQAAPEADVILSGFADGTKLRGILPIAPRLRWIHALSAGVEKILTPELIASRACLTNGRAVFGPALAEFTIAVVLHFAKDIRRLVRNQEAGRWEQFDVELIRGQVLGVIGYGGIGQEAARLAHGLGMRVMALRRRIALSQEDTLLERVFTPGELHELLGLSDYVLLAAPLTPETRGLIGEAELNAMKRSGVIINVGRGPLIQEVALIAALRDQRIRGAALDVYDQEPLPEGHPFFGFPNLLLSPHSADHTAGWLELAVERFVELFKRFQNGQPLEYVVDKKAGY